MWHYGHCASPHHLAATHCAPHYTATPSARSRADRALPSLNRHPTGTADGYRGTRVYCSLRRSSARLTSTDALDSMFATALNRSKRVVPMQRRYRIALSVSERGHIKDSQLSNDRTIIQIGNAEAASESGQVGNRLRDSLMGINSCTCNAGDSKSN